MVGYELTYPSGLIYLFDTLGRLVQIKNDSSSVIIEYLPNSEYIDTIIDGVGRKYKFDYIGYDNGINTMKFISSIAYYGKGSTELSRVSYRYNHSFQIIEVQKPGLDNVYYTYDSQNRLESVVNVDGRKNVYTYDSKGRVSNIREYGSDGYTFGDWINIYYNTSSTTFENSRGNKLTEIFDKYGKIIKVYNESNDQVEIDQNGGMLPKSRIVPVENNLLINHGFESGSSYFTNVTSTPAPVLNYYDVDSYSGRYNLKMTSTDIYTSHEIYQYRSSIKYNKLTLSAWVKTTGITDAYIKLKVYKSDGTYATLSSNPLDTVGKWKQVSVTFNDPNIKSSSVYVYLHMDGSGTVQFDNLQLTPGDEILDYNYIENGSFNNGSIKWNTSNNFLITSNNNLKNNYMSGSCARLTGGQFSNSKTQRVYINGKKDDIYTYGGWAYSNDVLPSTHTGESSNKRFFGMKIYLPDANGSGSYEFCDFQFNSTVIGLQNNKKSFCLPYDCKYLDIIYSYDYQSGYSYFTGTTLIKNTQNNVIFDESNNANNYIDEYTNNKLTKRNHDNGLIEEFTYNSKGNKLNSSLFDGSKYLEKKQTYTNDGNYAQSFTNIYGKLTSSTTDLNSGRVLSNSDGISYAYDSDNNVTRISKYVNGNGVAPHTSYTNYSYENKKLKSVNHGGILYNYDYNLFGQHTSFKIGNQLYYRYVYDNNTHLKNQIIYGNGDTVYNQYDNEKLIGVRFNNESNNRYIFSYNQRGDLTDLIDNHNNLRTKKLSNESYIYDLQTGSLKQSYTINLDRSSIKQKINNRTINSLYSCNKNEKNTTSKIEDNYGNNVLEIKKYDLFNRVINKKIGKSEFEYKLNSTYTYITNSDKTTCRIKSEAVNNVSNGSSVLDLLYSYNSKGSLSSISENGELRSNYLYNSLNQLFADADYTSNRETVYSYDTTGNISQKSINSLSTGQNLRNILYTYDSLWKDKLISYDGKNILYDEIGNPVNYDGKTYDWDAGRQLSSITSPGQNIQYKYDQNGLRMSKNINGVTTNYFWVDGILTAQETKGNYIYYRYDDSNNLLSLNYKGSEYYYIKNYLNDVLKITNSLGDVVVEYYYDAFGKLISTTGSMADTLGKENPYRYRGYYYDVETDYYYLQSRYYNPEWGRFLNADVIVIDKTLNGGNLFSYCLNDPINCIDRTGYAPESIVPEWFTELVNGIENKITDYLYSKIEFFIEMSEENRINYIADLIRGYLPIAVLIPNHLVRSAAESIYILGSKFFDLIVGVAGFQWDPEQRIFFSKENCWQKHFGYNSAYDQGARIIGFDIDWRILQFDYSIWNIKFEFWKGDYAGCTGAEMGIYKRSYNDDLPLNHHFCATDWSMPMKFELWSKKSRTQLFSRSDNHWWLTGFKLGEYHAPKNLDMYMHIKSGMSDFQFLLRDQLDESYSQGELKPMCEGLSDAEISRLTQDQKERYRDWERKCLWGTNGWVNFKWIG